MSTPAPAPPPSDRGLPIRRSTYRPGDKVLTSRGCYVEPRRETPRG